MGEEGGKEAFMREGESQEASLLRDLAMPDLLQQAFHEVYKLLFHFLLVANILVAFKDSLADTMFVLGFLSFSHKNFV
jgi:hypothetical protein